MHIQELRLYTHHLDRQRDFYARVLDLPLLSSSQDQFALAAGSSTLVFFAASEPQPLNYHFAFNISEPQFAEIKQWLTARIPLLTEPDGADELDFPDWQAHSIYFPDPDGNILEFIARRRLTHPQPQPRLARVSEIGLVVEQVPDFAQEIETRTGIPAFGDSSGEMFRAMGDDNGLLIAVKRGRLWLPDVRIPAREAPLAVRINHEGKIFWIEGPPYTFKSV